MCYVPFFTIPFMLLKFGRFNFPTSRALVMGILNATPDSFSDGGQFASLD